MARLTATVLVKDLLLTPPAPGPQDEPRGATSISSKAQPHRGAGHTPQGLCHQGPFLPNHRSFSAAQPVAYKPARRLLFSPSFPNLEVLLLA